jgi:hypothetical protein
VGAWKLNAPAKAEAVESSEHAVSVNAKVKDLLISIDSKHAEK